MLWNDDFHHSAMVALTGHNEAYYSDYQGSPQEFISAAKYGYLYQGQWYRWQGKRRGTPSFGVPPASFVTFLQNHDQIANSARGLRCRELSDPGTFKAITALTLLGPGTPMLFQGQEFAALTPFYYFADHVPELRRLVSEGRIEFMSQFVSMATPEMSGCLPDPGDRATFERSKARLVRPGEASACLSAAPRSLTAQDRRSCTAGAKTRRSRWRRARSPGVRAAVLRRQWR